MWSLYVNESKKYIYDFESFFKYSDSKIYLNLALPITFEDLESKEESE